MSDSKIHEFIHGTASLDGGMVSRTRCKCWQCGKPFYKTPQHAYKLSMKAKGKADGYVYFCSYSCMRVTQRALDEEKRRRDEEIDQICHTDEKKRGKKGNEQSISDRQPDERPGAEKYERRYARLQLYRRGESTVS